MIEVYPGVFVGDEQDCEIVLAGHPDWAIVHACKQPYHRQALGYTTPGAPKDHPEYLVARRGDRLMLNIVDASEPRFFDMGMLWSALDFIDEERGAGKTVLVHCNQGESRGPSVGLLYLAVRAHALPIESFEVAEAAFRQKYPSYAPGRGIREHLRLHWAEYNGITP